MISMTLRHAGVPLSPYEFAGISVAVCKMLAKSSSEYLPSGPRMRLDFKYNEQNDKHQRCNSNAYFPIVLSLREMARVARIAPPKATAKSCRPILSNGLSPNLLLNKSSVHFSSASSWDVVACHC